MEVTRFIKIGLLTALLAFSAPGIRPFPIFKGQDSRVALYVNEFKALGREVGLEFPRDPSIGLEPITGRAIGYCYRTLLSREIVLDSGSWAKASELTRRMLAYHELTHCYCGRGHEGGEMSDGCPSSLLFPRIVSDQCALAHFEHYTKEMFQRCKPYK